jgi:AAA domain-containing protein
MGILNIAPAERAGAHLLIPLYGPPRSGKTYTALRIARGMVGPAGRIGMLDTESGRARLYSDKVPGGFVVGELTPPYTPRRYLEAIEEFLRYGVDILVVDSFSHCWEGPGGVLEMADQAEEQGRKGLSKWLGPKRDYKKLVSFLLSTRLHMILCSRAKQPLIEAIIDGQKNLITQPWEPIQDKRLKYEMTIVVPMT